MASLITHINNLLGVKIRDEQLLHKAFMHTSYVNENRHKKLKSNERLEFLGDTVLELIVSNYLYHFYPEETEGNLSRMRAQLVSEPSLARLARSNQFQQYILLGKGEQKSGGQNRDSILADCFEAFLGAVYLDQGLNICQQILEDQLLKEHTTLLKQLNRDYKTLFQEFVQAKGAVNIEYRLLKQSGPDHMQTFEIGLFVNQKQMSKGIGKSKKQAEIQAAKTAYEFLIGENV